MSAVFPRTILARNLCSSHALWKSHYDVLGVDRKATDAQIKTAYIELSKKYHPDLNPGNPNLSDKYLEVREAYDTLSSALKRSEYDQYHVYQQQQQTQQQRWRQQQSQSQQNYDHHRQQQHSDFYAPKNPFFKDRPKEPPKPPKKWRKINLTLKLRGKEYKLDPFSGWFIVAALFTSWMLLSGTLYFLVRYSLERDRRDRKRIYDRLMARAETKYGGDK